MNQRPFIGLLALLFVAAAFFVTGVPDARAQELKVEMTLKRTDFLLYESVIVEVKITNNTNEDMELSSDDPQRPWISFLMTDSRGRTVRRDLGVVYPSRVVRAQGAPLLMTTDITPYYAFREVGEYRIQCNIRQPNGLQIVSAPSRFQVSEGKVLYSVSHRYRDSLLTYSILRFSPDLSTTYAYLRVTDDDANLVKSNMILGDMADTYTPQLLFDDQGNVHVLHVVGVGMYRYSRLSPTGSEIQHQSQYKSAGGIPPLLVATGGNVLVQGGAQDKTGERAKLSDTVASTPGAGSGPPPNFPNTPNKRPSLSQPGSIPQAPAAPGGDLMPSAPPSASSGGVPPPDSGPVPSYPPPSSSGSRPDTVLPSRGSRSK